MHVTLLFLVLTSGADRSVIDPLIFLGSRGRKRGIPDQLMNKDNRAKKISPSLLPQTSIAVQMYRNDGGSISEPTIFGVDPLASDVRKQSIRLQAFLSSYSFEKLFYEVSNDYGHNFKKALKFFIDITYRLSVTT